MKKILLGSMALTALLFGANSEVFNPKSAEHLVIKMQILDQKKNKDAGEIVAVQTPYGVAFFPNLKGLEAGLHGFHIHENADCGKTANHSLPWDDNGHKGDLPALYVDKDGNANSPVLAPKIKALSELKKHSLMIHFGGDNHSDHPAALGGGGARMACGVIK